MNSNDKNKLSVTIGTILLILSLICSITFFKKNEQLRASLEAYNSELDLCLNENKILRESFKDINIILESEQRRRADIESKLDIQKKITYLHPGVSAINLHPISDAIWNTSQQEDIDPELIIALIQYESRFNKYAVSPVGAVGLTQVMPMWIDQLDFVNSRRQLFDIGTNIKAGVYIYKHYLDMYNQDSKLALLAYNRGPNRVNTDIKRNKNPSNGYELAVLGYYRKLKKINREE